MSKKFPPFGKRLQSLLAIGQIPTNNVFIFIGNLAWQEGNSFSKSQYVLILPPEITDPDIYIWPVKNCLPLVFDTSGVELLLIKKLAYILLVSGALRVHVVLADSRQIIYSGDIFNDRIIKHQ